MGENQRFSVAVQRYLAYPRELVWWDVENDRFVARRSGQFLPEQLHSESPLTLQARCQRTAILQPESLVILAGFAQRLCTPRPFLLLVHRRWRLALLLALNFFDAADLKSRLDPFGGKPADVHFQRITRRAGGAVVVFGFRLHVLDIDDLALCV